MTPTTGYLYRPAEDQVSVMMESTCQLDNILEVNSEGLIIESMMIRMNEIGVEEEITLVGTGEKGLIAADRDMTTKAIRANHWIQHGKDSRGHRHTEVQVRQGHLFDSGIPLQCGLTRIFKKGP
jgi:hypothetical protein